MEKVAILKEFKDFCSIDLQLADATVESHLRYVRMFLESVSGADGLRMENLENVENIRRFLAGFKGKSPCHYANVLKSLEGAF
ncbi:MAG: hypothetical protein QXG34_03930, partial [Candidatus Bathyarchaeia archaeon]